ADGRARQPEPRGQADGRDHEAVVSAELGGQGPVQLDAGQRQVAERADRQAGGAEVVEHDADATGPQRLEGRAAGRRVLEGGRRGHLDGQYGRVDVRTVE